MTYYYAVEDENRVLCVDQLDTDQGRKAPWTEEEVAYLAERYPDTIYFQTERYFCLTYACGLCRGCKAAGQPMKMEAHRVYGG